MNNENTIRLKTDADGSLIQIMPDGSERPYSLPTIDVVAIDAMTDQDIAHQVETNPDAAPIPSDEDLERGFFGARVRRVRAGFGLTQAGFAERFGVPAASLRDWEQGRRAPDAATKAYLTVIEREPEAVLRALSTGKAA